MPRIPVVDLERLREIEKTLPDDIYTPWTEEQVREYLLAAGYDLDEVVRWGAKLVEELLERHNA